MQYHERDEIIIPWEREASQQHLMHKDSQGGKGALSPTVFQHCSKKSVFLVSLNYRNNSNKCVQLLFDMWIGGGLDQLNYSPKVNLLVGRRFGNSNIHLSSSEIHVLETTNFFRKLIWLKCQA